MSLGLIALTLLPFVLTPGASFTITVGAAVDGDRHASLRVWAGTALGLGVIAAAVAASGVGDYVAASPTAQAVLGLVGGGVLIALAVGSGLRARAVLKGGVPEGRPQQRLVLWSFLAVVTNVKALSLYAVVLPTGVTAGTDSLTTFAVAAAAHITMLLAWLTLVGALVRRAPALRRSARARAALFAFAGLALALLGVRSILDVI